MELTSSLNSFRNVKSSQSNKSDVINTFIKELISCIAKRILQDFQKRNDNKE